jgi:hypothetical protein
MRCPSFSDLRERIRVAVRRRLGIDTRTLAAFRVSLGLVVLVNLAARTRDLRAFYTGEGALPSTAVQGYTTLSRYSLYAVSDSVVFVALLFVVTAALAVALVVGYRTRLASVGVLLLVFSLNARNPLAMNGGDALLTRLLFWSVFLPLGARWSVDSRRDERDYGGRVTSVATAALSVQVVVVYVVNAVFKLRSDIWMSGDAVTEVFALTAYTTPLGSFLAEIPDLLVLLNYSWVALLVASPLLLVLTGRLRAVLIALFVGAQLGLLLTMELAVFPLVSVVGLVALTPSVVWDLLSGRVPPRGRNVRFLDEATPRKRGFGVPRPSVDTAVLHRCYRTVAPPVVAVCLVAVLLTNASAMGYVETDATDGMSDRIDGLERYVGYKWSLFAPYPPTTDRWYVFRGETASGDVVDPLRLAPYEMDLRPDPFPNARWRKYLDGIHTNDAPRLREHLGEYLCDRWNRRKDDALKGVGMRFATVGTDGPETTEVFHRSCAAP